MNEHLYTANLRTTAAFERFKKRVPQKDAVGVAKLKEAGAIVVGKMNMHQLGMGTTGLENHVGPVPVWDWPPLKTTGDVAGARR